MCIRDRVKAHNPGEQLERCAQEYKQFGWQWDVWPMGAAFTDWPTEWVPSRAEIHEFADTATALGCQEISFYRAGIGRGWDDFPEVKQAAYEVWPPETTPEPPPPPPSDIQELIDRIESLEDIVKDHEIRIRALEDNGV